ncbi:putative tetratricopeptide-like helical domain-containing protein [Rosa chinensis]|uniref:Putative tetratricopeptide-like helical domain-containing protein n=1 Tax=Rosa chinensis TaxID=74649 RepID=A0A2P6PXJ5_ROSCH|nr:putative tetratricopeptide-like helical domain-containing protein [Rosa chinensis]
MFLISNVFFPKDGKYSEALGKRESALMLMPKSAVLHEQKAQVLIEIGDAWNAKKAATRATELEPSVNR